MCNRQNYFGVLLEMPSFLRFLIFKFTSSYLKLCDKTN